MVAPPPQHKISKQLAASFGNSWQPPPQLSKEQAILPTKSNGVRNHHQDDFADENSNSNLIVNHIVFPQQRIVKQLAPFGNSWNIDARPFYSSKFVKDPIENQLHERLKRTRSGNAANSMIVNDITEYNTKPLVVEPEKPENKTRRKLSLSPERAGNSKLTEFLPDDEDFEEAIIAAVLGSTNEAGKNTETNNSTSEVFQMKIDKRLKVFQDITLSLSPKA